MLFVAEDENDSLSADEVSVSSVRTYAGPGMCETERGTPEGFSASDASVLPFAK